MKAIVPLIRVCARRRRPFLFGTAAVLGLAPFYNIPGDYYEMGSIITTRVVTVLRNVDSTAEDTAAVADALEQDTPPSTPAFAGIRSDDIYLLIEKLVLEPASLGLDSPGAIASGFMLVFLSFIVDVLLAFLTYALGSLVARALVGEVRAPPL